MSRTTTENATPGADRALLTDDLHRRYAGGGLWGLTRIARFWRTKYARRARAAAGRILKRTLDILVSATMLVCLGPLFAVVALLIKLTDRGPVLFWQKRVGRWGREFPFPKFRSMVVNAEKLKKRMLGLLEHLRAELARAAGQRPDLDEATRAGLRAFAGADPARAAALMEKLAPPVRAAIEA